MKESAIWGSEREREGKKIIYIGMIRKIYNMAQVTHKKKLEAVSERKNIIIINFDKRNG